eukprot:jgi/Tetstr1/422379/TSEL_013219.t1
MLQPMAVAAVSASGRRLYHSPPCKSSPPTSRQPSSDHGQAKGTSIADSRPPKRHCALSQTGRAAKVCAADGCSAAAPATGASQLLCPDHLKAEEFLRDGEPSRFCTQCTRAHDLASFDGKQRACRARVERRNKRRTAPNRAKAATTPRAPAQMPRNTQSHDTSAKQSPPDAQQSPPDATAVVSGHAQEPTAQLAGRADMALARGEFFDSHGGALHNMPPSKPVISDASLLFLHVATAQGALSGSPAMGDGSLVSSAPQRCFPTASNIAMKMLSITPASLDPHLRQHLEFLMEAVPADVQGAMRPGCVLLSVDLWFTNREELQQAQEALRRNLLNGAAGRLLGQADMDVYLRSHEYTVRQGALVKQSKRQESSAIVSADPVVCNPGVTEWRVVVRKSSPDAELRMVCRVKGRFFDVESQEEDELPDGRVQYVLWAPMDDAALGLAWLEVIETLPGGREAISQAHPMFLTTRCDICQEMTSLFQNASPAARREMAGILKDLEAVLHPEDDKAALDASLPVPLALLCARHGFHQTLEELLDEVEYRGPDGGLAAMVDRAMQAYPGGIAAGARLSGSRETADVVRRRLLAGEAIGTPSDASTTTGDSSRGALQETDLQFVDAPPEEAPRSAGAACNPWGWNAVKALEHPAVVLAMFACSLALFSRLPWSDAWRVSHALWIVMSLHVLLPALYHRVYVHGLHTVEALAAEKGVALCAGGLSVADAHLRERFRSVNLRLLRFPLHRGAFVIWLLFATFFIPLYGLRSTGASDLSWRAVTLCATCSALLFALRELAINRQSLLSVQRINTCAEFAPLAPWLLSAFCAWNSGSDVYAFPSVLAGASGSEFLWVLTGVMRAAFRVLQAATLPSSIRDLWVIEPLHGVAAVLAGYFNCASLTSHSPAEVPYAWVTWAVVIVPGSIAYVASRVLLELNVMQWFLSRHVHRSKSE